MVEYGLIVAVIGLVVGAAAGSLGHDISTIFGTFGRALGRVPLPG
jgi:Flp pilus assembly pilin Flp